MNRRLFTILLSAFVIAAVCSFLVFRVVSHRIGGPPVAKTTRVVAAALDIKLGSILKDSDLTTVEIAGALPPGAILKPQDAVGRGVISDLYAGEPILTNRLSAPGSGGGLAATIPQGMRADAIRVDDVVGVAGFVTPGMHVDVLVSGTPPGATGAGSTETKTVLQNIQVLSAGTDIQKDAEGKPVPVQVVNLLVTPDQAQLLSLAGNQTRIQLVLRNPLDTKLAEPAATTVSQLYGGPAQPTPPHYARRVKAAPRIYEIQVINGTQKSESKFPVEEEKQ